MSRYIFAYNFLFFLKFILRIVFRYIGIFELVKIVVFYERSENRHLSGSLFLVAFDDFIGKSRIYRDKLRSFNAEAVESAGVNQVFDHTLVHAEVGATGNKVFERRVLAVCISFVYYIVYYVHTDILK